MAASTAHPPLHTAEHLITRLLYHRFPTLTEFNTRLKSDKAVISFTYHGSIVEEDRRALESQLQAICQAALPVTIDFMARAEAEKQLPNLHQVPYDADPVRVVRVGSGNHLADERACIGRHVSNTSEIKNPRLPTLRLENNHQWRINLMVTIH